MQARSWITLSVIIFMALSGLQREVRASGESATVVIETRIKKKALSFQAGMKSTQTMVISYDQKQISNDFITGVTELLGVQLKSVRDNFTVKKINFAGKVANFEAEGETASGVVFMPNINYKFAITVDLSAGEVVLSGCHDGYPSYRIMVQGKEVYSFEQENATALFGSCDINVPHTVKKL